MKKSGQGRSNGPKTRNEFRDQQRSRALLGKPPFGPPHARIGLQRNLAKQLQYLDSLDSPEQVPDRICGQRRTDAQQQRSHEAEPPRARQRARRQKNRERRNRHTNLLRKHPSEQNDIALVQQELRSALHLSRGPYSHFACNETSSMPP